MHSKIQRTKDTTGKVIRFALGLLGVFSLMPFLGCSRSTTPPASTASTATPAPATPQTQARMDQVKNSGMAPQAQAIEMGRAAQGQAGSR